jgi:hypothetical protein
MRSSETIASLAAALVEAQKGMPNVPKETVGQVGNQKRNYADLATVTETARPIMSSAGLAWVQGCSDGASGSVTVTTRIMHTSGEWIEESLSMPTGQGGAQQVGSAITYARRYSLMAMLGLAPEDDDGAAAQAAHRPQEQQQAASEGNSGNEGVRVVRLINEAKRDHPKAHARLVEFAADNKRDLTVRALAEDSEWRRTVEHTLGAFIGGADTPAEQATLPGVAAGEAENGADP